MSSIFSSANKRWRRYVVSALALCGVLLATNSAFAGDCKQVKFKFTNSTGAKINVKSIDIKGNDGSWNENISNQKIDSGKSYTTGKRTMNKLDSGKSGTFTVKYERWNADNNEYRDKTQSYNQTCSDNKTLAFVLTN